MGNLSDIHTAGHALGGAAASVLGAAPALAPAPQRLVEVADHVAGLRNMHQAMRAMGVLLDGQRDPVALAVRSEDLAALIGIMTDEFDRRVSTLETSIEQMEGGR